MSYSSASGAVPPPKQCNWCFEDIKFGALLDSCPRCLAPFHPDCLDEYRVKWVDKIIKLRNNGEDEKADEMEAQQFAPCPSCRKPLVSEDAPEKQEEMMAELVEKKKAPKRKYGANYTPHEEIIGMQEILFLIHKMEKKFKMEQDHEQERKQPVRNVRSRCLVCSLFDCVCLERPPSPEYPEQEVYGGGYEPFGPGCLPPLEVPESPEPPPLPPQAPVRDENAREGYSNVVDYTNCCRCGASGQVDDYNLFREENNEDDDIYCNDCFNQMYPDAESPERVVEDDQFVVETMCGRHGCGRFFLAQDLYPSNIAGEHEVCKECLNKSEGKEEEEDWTDTPLPFAQEQEKKREVIDLTVSSDEEVPGTPQEVDNLGSDDELDKAYADVLYAEQVMAIYGQQRQPSPEPE